MSDTNQDSQVFGQQLILLYRVSGTDPTKEASVRVWVSHSPHSAHLQAKKILTDLFQSQIDHILEDKQREASIRHDETESILADLDDCVLYLESQLAYILEQLEKTGQIAPVRPWIAASSSASSKHEVEVYRAFNEPPEATLVCIDYQTSYDYHYYLEIKPVNQNNRYGTEFILHEH
jgi:hypothetical protein